MGKTQPCTNYTVQLSEGAKFSYFTWQVVKYRYDLGGQVLSLLQKQLSQTSDILQYTLKHNYL